MSNLMKVREFMVACGNEIHERPQFPTERTAKLRIALIEEELQELKDAVEANDIVAVADALGDLLYVVYGGGPNFGIPLDRVFADIHESNMTKVVDGVVIKNDAGKVLKPLTYRPPNLKKVLFPYEEGE